MIRTWHLKNFKSYRDMKPLQMAPINIIAGANSSGKSTIIQSILLLKQTVQYGSENRSLALNGPLLRLGSFEDVRHFEATGEEMEIELLIEADSTGGSRATSSWDRVFRRSSGLAAKMYSGVSMTLSFGEKQITLAKGIENVSSGTLTPELRSASLEVYEREHGDLIEKAKICMRQRSALGSNEDDPFAMMAPYSIEFDEGSVAQLASGRPSASIEGAYSSFFLPSYVVVRFDVAAQRAKKLADDICNPSDSLIGSPNLTSETISKETLDVVNRWLVEEGQEPLPFLSPILAAEVRKSLMPILRRTQADLFNLIKPSEEMRAAVSRLRQGIQDQILKENGVEYANELEESRPVRAASDFVQEYLKKGVRYLGPLRDSPRPVYQLEALESTTDVGYRGEHTAAVLDLNSGRLVSYHKPPKSGDDTDFVSDASRRLKTLHDAVVEWLTYLGVADEVATTDAGVFGNRLQVSTGGVGRLHDLTNVGVGVSQVLPLVVMALLAPKGSLLIFEQPELHLHPKVQSRLADFILSLALDGKQVLLETHSEYLIDRLRLRIALSRDDRVRPLLNILFSEKDGPDSRLVPIDISEYGAVLNWPKDFFEQSQRDVAALIEAASRKRKAARGSKGSPS